MAYNTAITDALSAVANSNAPSLKFATWFGTGVSLGSITEITAGTNYQQNITGTDALTGCTFPDSLQSFMGSNVQTYIQMIPDPTTPAWTAGTVTTQIENILQSTDCPQAPSGARELYQPVHSRVAAIGGSSSKPQIDFHITRPGSGGAPASELSEIYVSMWHYIPPELDSILDYAASANYYTLWDWKTGGYGGNTGYGDYRVALLVYRGSVGGGLQYKLSGDNAANGNWDGSTTIPTVGTSNIGSGGYWQIKSAPGSANADLGYWVRIHLYIKRPVLSYVRSSSTESGARDPMYTQDTTTGITFCAVENPTTGRFLVVGSKIGGRQTGCENLPFTRMMNSMCYCTASDGVDPIVYARATGLQIWNRPSIYLPITVTKRSQAPLYWPLLGSLALQNGSGTPTFTRATTATTFNTEGNIVNIPSGAVRFAGARPVVNWFKDSSIMASSANWEIFNASKTTTTGPDGVSRNGCLVTCTANSSNYFRQQYDSAVIGGNIRTYRFLYKPGTATWMRILFYAGVTDRVSIWFNATTNLIGTVTTGGTGWSISSYGLTASTTYSGWYEIYAVVTSPSTGTHFMSINFAGSDNGADYTNVNGQYFTIAYSQLENSTGRTDKTPSEYVATGLPSPYYGAGADGVKYFATNKDGSTIADSALQGVIIEPVAITNNLLGSRLLSVVTGSIAWGSSTNAGTEKVINGTFDTDLSGWTAGDGTGATITWNNGTVSCYAGGVNSNVLLRQSITGLTVGKTYTVTADFLSSTPSKCAVYISYASGYATAPFITTPYTAKVTFIAGASTLSLQLVGGTASATAVIDNVSMKEADVQITNDTGIDNQANACSVLTATTNNATILQTIYTAATTASFGFYVKRKTGTGSIYITRDGGTNWTDITSSINSSTFSLVKIENTSVLNPQVGFKIATSGDAIIVDGGMNHSGAQLSKYPIFTTTASVTRNADVLTCETSGNFSDTAGTMMATVSRDDWTVANGSAVGSSTRGLYTSSANSGAQGLDGTNTVNGPTGTPSGSMKIGLRWSGTSLQVYSNGVFGNAGSYDGGFNLSSIALAAGAQCTIKDVAIWHTSLSDTEMVAAANNI